MDLAILNYNTGSVDLYTIPDTYDTPEDVETLIQEDLGYNIDEIYYMTSDGIYVNDNRKNN